MVVNMMYNKNEDYLKMVVTMLLEGSSYAGIDRKLFLSGVQIERKKLVELDNKLNHISYFISNL